MFKILDFDFDASDVATKVIMKPLKLKEVFHELDMSSASIGIKITHRLLCFSTEGDLGKIKVKIFKISLKAYRFYKRKFA